MSSSFSRQTGETEGARETFQMRKMNNEGGKQTWQKREGKSKGGDGKIKCRKGRLGGRQWMARNGQYRRGEQPKWQRIKVTNAPPVTLQLPSLMGGLGD